MKKLEQDRVLAPLAKTPRRIEQITSGLDPDQLRARTAESEWSLNDILAHLRSNADVWGGYIIRILEEDAPRIKAISPRTWIKSTDYLDWEFRSSFCLFVSERQALLEILQSMSNAAWTRGATITGAGKVLQRTVLTYARTLAQHEQPHIRQIARTANRLTYESARSSFDTQANALRLILQTGRWHRVCGIQF